MLKIDLPEKPSVPSRLTTQLERVYEELATAKPSLPTEEYIKREFGIDLTARYGGHAVRSPFGKASGQLSMTPRQVADDVEAGLGFIVLKTVIAQDETGQQSMGAWATHETRMLVERIQGRSGESGWTVSWKGRGWHKSFAEYLQLIREARQLAEGTGCLIVPSCKYHLPADLNESWNLAEYEYTTKHLFDAWQGRALENEQPGGLQSMPLEKDFSPTLAGDQLSEVREQILAWLTTVPGLIKQATEPLGGQVHLGLKIFNTLFDDDFQLELLSAIHQPSTRPDFFIYGNRLFDPAREFDGKRGIAYGGPDLSDRNLSVLTQYRETTPIDQIMPLSATGDIQSGRRAVEYMLCGAENFQLHTFFQLPASEYACRVGNKTAKALHELYFHPRTGFIAWLVHLADRLDLPTDEISFRTIVSEIRNRGVVLNRCA